jgi:hypothetical protein
MQRSSQSSQRGRWPWHTRPLATVLSLALCFLALSFLPPGAIHSATAAARAAGMGAPNVDIRTRIQPHKRPSAAQIADLHSLPAARMQWDDQWGQPSSLISDAGHLTAPSHASAEAIARGFLHDHAQLFGLSVSDPGNLVVAKQYLTQHNGVAQLTLQQRDRGRDVYGAVVTFAIDKTGRILIVGSRLAPGAGAAAGAQLTPGDAVTKAGAAVGASSSGPLPTPTISNGRYTYPNTFAHHVYKPNPVTSELVTFPVPGGAAHLGWKVIMLVDDQGWYETVIDALSGQLLYRRNYTLQAGPEGNVFTGESAGTGSQQITSFNGDPSFDNDGWVSGTTTSGNNVNAYQDLNDSQTVGYQPQTPGSPDPAFQHFDYNFTNAYFTSGGTDVTTDRNAVITQEFYYTNFMHDYLYRLGFNEASGNFQVDNFGRGGAGNDPLLAEADDGFSNTPPSTNNANMSTPADGSSPRMQMYVFTKPPFTFHDGDMDSTVVFHEYTHGLSNRLVGGGNLGSGTQTGAMGEGWSDWMAATINNDPVIGAYVTGNAATGIRRVAYNNSSWTYSSLCNAGCEVHNDGEIWATVLWDLRTKLQQRYGTSSGKATAEQLVVDGMKNTVSTPTFLNGRDGILAADQADNAGANRCLIWEVFAIRGMGVSATSSADQNTVTQGTDVPANCPSHFSYNGATSGDYNDAATLSTVLTDAVGLPIANQTVTLATAGQSCNAKTDATGTASCQVTPAVDPGTFTITQSFGGAAGYNAVTDTSQTFTVTKEESQLTNPGTLTVHYHDPVTVSAQLSDPVDGVGIGGKSVTFTLGGTDTCSGMTDGFGNVSCSLTPHTTGTQTLVASFAGDTDYVGSTRTDLFAITPEETTMTYTGPTVILAGASGATLSAKLVEDGSNDNDGDGGSPGPIPAQTVTLSVGSQSCTGTTDSSGNVKCTIPSISVPLGPETIGASFAGNAYYQAASDSKSAVVFAFPSTGAFTLGDITAATAGSSTVTWWADTWWQLNALSGGTAPSSFKGFAGVITLPTTTPPSSCGSNWTTSGGNSPPPASGVPSYMGVVVTSKVTKTGTTIVGNSVHIVVVKVNPGYSTNPMSHGTGTIVATFC